MGRRKSTPMVFERYEAKYLINRRQKERILQAVAPYMEPDEYGRSTIRNIYYDTDDYRLVRTSFEKPVYKEKLRVRSYRTAGADDEVFIELKRKYDSVVYKRRTSATERQAREYLAGRGQLPYTTQITEEINYFLWFYKTLAPKVFLSYEREAYRAREAGEFRVTFDENILWRETDLSLGKGVYGCPLLEPDQVLMEVKTLGGMPLWMVHVLSREEIRKTTFSKYGNVYRRIAANEKGEPIYA